MNYTLEPSRAARHIIELRYSAWEKCGNCNGFGERNVGDKEWICCSVCDGSCGVWHPKVRLGGEPSLPAYIGWLTITKSSTLILSGEACGKCKGIIGYMDWVGDGKCPACHDVGIEPGTENWEVE